MMNNSKIKIQEQILNFNFDKKLKRPTNEEVAHSLDVDQFNQSYNLIGWQDGLIGINPQPVHVEQTNTDGIKYDYGTIEFQNDERYELRELLEAGAESSSEINGSILGKYYRMKGNVVKKGRIYQFVDEGSNENVLEGLKKKNVVEAVHSVSFDQTENLNSLSKQFNDIFMGDETISRYQSSDTVSDLTEWMDSNKNLFPDYGTDKYALPYVPNNLGYNAIWSNIHRMLFYLNSSRHPINDYSTYKSPRDTGFLNYSVANKVFVRPASLEEFELLVGQQSFSSANNGSSYNNEIIQEYLNQGSNRSLISPSNPFGSAELSNPIVYISNEGNLIYREPVYVSVPLITLFLNPLFISNNFNSFSKSANLSIPLDFPISSNGIGDIPFAAIHKKIQTWSPTRSADSTNTGFGDAGASTPDSNSQWGTSSTFLPPDLSQGYNPAGYTNSNQYSSSYDSNGNYIGNSNSNFNSGSTYTQVPIEFWEELDPYFKKPIDILYGVKWNIVYTTKTKGKLVNYKSYQPKIGEGYSNEFGPFIDADGVRHDSSKSIQFKLKDSSAKIPFVKVYQGSWQNAQYNMGLSNQHITIDYRDYEKVFLNQNGWVAKGGTNSANYSLHDGFIHLNNLFNGTMRSSLDHFPFKDFGMEIF